MEIPNSIMAGAQYFKVNYKFIRMLVTGSDKLNNVYGIQAEHFRMFIKL